MKEAKTSSDDKIELIILELQILKFQIHKNVNLFVYSIIFANVNTNEIKVLL